MHLLCPWGRREERRPSPATQVCSLVEESAGGVGVLAASPAALTHLPGEPGSGHCVAPHQALGCLALERPRAQTVRGCRGPSGRGRLLERSGAADLTNSCGGKPRPLADWGSTAGTEAPPAFPEGPIRSWGLARGRGDGVGRSGNETRA